MVEELFNKYYSKKATPEERAAFLSLVADPTQEGRIKEMIEKTFYTKEPELPYDLDSLDAIFTNIIGLSDRNAPAIEPVGQSPVVTAEEPEVTRMFAYRKFYYVAAAVLIAIIMGGIYYWGSYQSGKPAGGITRPATAKTDALPGGNKATLTLANGAVIVLDNAHNGSLAQQGGTSVIKLDSGQLAYNNNVKDNSVKGLFNTISTPRGGQYQVVLPDGSKVWLNAASSIHFPVAFTGKERNVELTGEAYFDVKKDKDKPFAIAVNGVQVLVMGTEVNVMAYADEPEMKATLISGSVKVRQGAIERFLKPGQEAALNNQTSAIQIREADTDGAVAWTKGQFQFSGADIPTIMRQLSRWYDVEVRYEGDIPERQITGEAPRNITLSRLLKILSMNDVHFTIDKNKITVKP